MLTAWGARPHNDQGLTGDMIRDASASRAAMEAERDPVIESIERETQERQMRLGALRARRAGMPLTQDPSQPFMHPNLARQMGIPYQPAGVRGQQNVVTGQNLAYGGQPLNVQTQGVSPLASGGQFMPAPRQPVSPGGAEAYMNRAEELGVQRGQEIDPQETAAHQKEIVADLTRRGFTKATAKGRVADEIVAQLPDQADTVKDAATGLDTGMTRQQIKQELRTRNARAPLGKQVTFDKYVTQVAGERETDRVRAEQRRYNERLKDLDMRQKEANVRATEALAADRESGGDTTKLTASQQRSYDNLESRRSNAQRAVGRLQTALGSAIGDSAKKLKTELEEAHSELAKAEEEFDAFRKEIGDLPDPLKEEMSSRPPPRPQGPGGTYAGVGADLQGPPAPGNAPTLLPTDQASDVVVGTHPTLGIIRQSDIEATARKHGLTIDQVRQRLGI